MQRAFPVRLIVVLIIPFLCDSNVTISPISVTVRHSSSRYPRRGETRNLIIPPRVFHKQVTIIHSLSCAVWSACRQTGVEWGVFKVDFTTFDVLI